LSGDLVFFQECIVLITTPFVGAVADKLGRRPPLMLGILLIGTTYALYPFADSVATMYAYRIFFGVGLAEVGRSVSAWLGA